MNNDGTAEVVWKDYYVDEDSGQRSQNNVDHPGKVGTHDDFRAAMAVFNEHWLIRGEEVAEPKGSYPFDKSLKNLDRVTVTSITFSGGEPLDADAHEEEKRTPVAVHIQGTMKLRGGGVKNYCLPAIKLGAPQEKYKFSSHLDQHLAALEGEVWPYVDGSKHAPDPQQAMEFPPADGQRAIGDGLDVSEIGAGEGVAAGDADEAEGGGEEA